MVTRKKNILKLLKYLEEIDRSDFTLGLPPRYGAVSLTSGKDLPKTILPEDLAEGEFIETLPCKRRPRPGFEAIYRKEGNFLVKVAEAGDSKLDADVWYARLNKQGEEILAFIKKYGEEEIKKYL